MRLAAVASAAARGGLTGRDFLRLASEDFQPGAGDLRLPNNDVKRVCGRNRASQSGGSG
jgi:hypothetical protein